MISNGLEEAEGTGGRGGDGWPYKGGNMMGRDKEVWRCGREAKDLSPDWSSLHDRK